MQGRHLDFDRDVRLLPQLLSHVSSLHEANVLHGDLHQRNVLVTPSDHVFIIDFDQATIMPGQRRKQEELAALKSLASSPTCKSLLF